MVFRSKEFLRWRTHTNKGIRIHGHHRGATAEEPIDQRSWAKNLRAEQQRLIARLLAKKSGPP